MSGEVIIVTGAAGFIGSSLIVALSKEYSIIALDKRKPSLDLSAATSGVRWVTIDIGNKGDVNNAFSGIKEDFGQIDFIIHLAAYYDFGNVWVDEYEKTNIRGTENIINAAIDHDARRLIFSSSIAAMEPPGPNNQLNEQSSTSNYFPYACSKSVGETMVKNASKKIPCITLRLAGVFSDWCELPPLFSLIRLWSSSGPFSRMIPGKGKSGIPYIHLADVIGVIKRCIELNHQIGPSETFMASQYGTVIHNELFLSIRKSFSKSRSISPLYLPATVMRTGLIIKNTLGSMGRQVPFEQPWMLAFIDRPWVINNSQTGEKLKWQCRTEYSILQRIPMIIKNFENQKQKWHARNMQRITLDYHYSN